MVGEAVASESVWAAETSRLMFSMLTVAETGEVRPASTPTPEPAVTEVTLDWVWEEVAEGPMKASTVALSVAWAETTAPPTPLMPVSCAVTCGVSSPVATRLTLPAFTTEPSSM